MLSAREITELYKIYGFSAGPAFEKYLVFFSESGYFQYAEIVVLDTDFDEAQIDKQEYEAVGYSVRIQKFSMWLSLLISQRKSPDYGIYQRI